ncbi:MAG TPA: hemerythrin domain-containing protein [Methylomirabilota bacterium]|nr:hemerythrin domain-containing protein [Methylomirabilota bacterium]
MDAIQFLKQEHDKAKAAFGKLLSAVPAERGAIWKELAPELKVHEKVEEQCLYGPIARDGVSEPALSEWVSDRHQDEVHEVEGLIEETESLDPEDERWLVTLRQIKSALENHIRQEEQDIFPRVGRIWDRARLEEAGRQMAESKAEKSARRG